MKFFDFVLGALLVVAIAFGVAELVATEPYVVQGRVIALEHTPASGATSIGFSNDQPIVVSTHKGEKWTLVVDVDGEVNVFDVPPQVYYSVGEGDHIEMTCRKGRLFGVVSCRSAQLRAK
ncbi:MAG: hypothetical protein AB1509_12575 [Chloroflexota bacterium]